MRWKCPLTRFQETVTKLTNRPSSAGLKKFGLKLIDVQEGCAKVEMHFTQDTENMFGMAHGGVIFSLMDAAFEVASIHTAQWRLLPI